MNYLLQKLIDNSDPLSKNEAEKLLQELRQEVDNLDAGIARLLIQRIEISLYIGKIKKLLKLSSYSPEREAEILKNVVNLAGDDLSKKVLKNIYERIIDESRGIQKLRSDNEL